MRHFWVESTVGQNCSHCDKYIRGKNHFNGVACAWCKAAVHDDCKV